jgi:hypothetical protein
MEIVILFIGTLTYLYLSDLQRSKTEKERFREFVIANKANNINEYVEALPNDEKLDIEQDDELIDLDQLTPEELLDIKSKELR